MTVVIVIMNIMIFVVITSSFIRNLDDYDTKIFIMRQKICAQQDKLLCVLFGLHFHIFTYSEYKNISCY